MVKRFSEQHRDLIDYMFEEITLYARSFRWGFHGAETEENRAALISTHSAGAAAGGRFCRF